MNTFYKMYIILFSMIFTLNNYGMNYYRNMQIIIIPKEKIVLQPEEEIKAEISPLEISAFNPNPDAPLKKNFNDDAVEQVFFTPEENLIISASNHEIKIQNIKELEDQELETITCYSPIQWIEYYPTHKILIWQSNPWVKLLNLEDPEMQPKIFWHPQVTHSTLFFEKNILVLSSSEKMSICSTTDKNKVTTFTGNYSEHIRWMKLLPEENMLVSCSPDHNVVQFWDITNLGERRLITYDHIGVDTQWLKFCPEDKILITCAPNIPKIQLYSWSTEDSMTKIRRKKLPTKFMPGIKQKTIYASDSTHTVIFGQYENFLTLLCKDEEQDRWLGTNSISELNHSHCNTPSREIEEEE